MINSVTNAATFGRKMNRRNGRMNFYLSITGKQFYNGRRDLCVPFHFFFFIWKLEKFKKIFKFSKVRKFNEYGISNDSKIIIRFNNFC